MRSKPVSIGRKIVRLQSVTSTNTELLDRSDRYENGDVMIAEEQRAGRGRYRRSWHSPSGGIYMSILIKEMEKPEEILKLSLLSALAIQRTLSSLANTAFYIKWPNDVYAGDSKICGILPETRVQGKNLIAVIGIGINVNNEPASGIHLRNPAVSLCELSGKKHDLNTLVKNILQLTDNFYSHIRENRFGEYLPELEQCLYGRGKTIILKKNDGQQEDIIPLGFTEDAALRCIRNGKEDILYMGEL